jgi:hypothetical protein
MRGEKAGTMRRGEGVDSDRAGALEAEMPNMRARDLWPSVSVSPFGRSAILTGHRSRGKMLVAGSERTHLMNIQIKATAS